MEKKSLSECLEMLSLKMGSSSSSTTNVTIKLYTDKTNGRVVYAEAEKPFVDFLIHILKLPIQDFLKLDDLSDHHDQKMQQIMEGTNMGKLSQAFHKCKGAQEAVVAGYAEDSGYIVTDNLTILPMSANPHKNVLKDYYFRVGETGDLQENEVEVGMLEAIKIMKAAVYRADTVLTHVFVEKGD